jgi:chromosome segregation ATPase
MTTAVSSAGTGSGAATCMFPGCGRPTRERAGEGGGKPPIYCDLVNPATGKLAHTPLTAARERARRERHSAEDQPPALVAEAPASTARDRAAGLLDQFQAGAEQLRTTLAMAIEAMTVAGDPDSVSAELAAARRQVERARLEADERIQAADAARDQALAEASAARHAADDASAARDEALTELDALEGALTAVRAELDSARADHADQLAVLRAEHASDMERLRAEAADRISAAEHRAAEQLHRAQADAAGRIQAAETTRDQALADASAARQAATDATNRAQEAREELRQAREEMRAELAAQRREHREELAAERARADTALDTLRAEHRHQTQTLQAALAALRDTGTGATEPRESAGHPPRAARRAATPSDQASQ